VQPYRLYAIDKFPHEEWKSQFGLYSGIPYVTGHSEAKHPDMSVAWMTAAETHVDVLDYSPPGKRRGRLVNFITEGGQLEFFLFGAKTPKRNQKLLAKLTGFAPIPPLFSLGFHYSKWESTTARKVMTYNDKFEENGFPLDVLWLDIGHTNDGQYFTFDPLHFNVSDLENLRNKINVSDRRLVVITDPHIKQSPFYHVYMGGKGLETVSDTDGTMRTSIFVKS